jgi:Carboxypeptidase regulatory-like domain/Putative zinc-finger
MSELLHSGHHPDADQLNAFVENTLPAHELEQTLAHLAVCPDCREIVALSLSPVDDRLPSPVYKPWFFRWNLAWPAIAAVTAIVFIIALVRNGAITRNSAGVPTQVAASHQLVPLQPLTVPQISNPNPPAPPDNRPPNHRHRAVASDAALANLTKDKTTFDPLTAEGPLLQNGLPQPASTSGTQAIHGQLRPPVNGAGVGLATVSPQNEPAFPTDHFQQSPTGSSATTTANASGRLIEAPLVAPAPDPAPPPLAAPIAAASTNQTVEVTDAASAVTLPTTSSDIQLNQARNIVTHLPSNLPVLSMVSNAHQVLAIDTQHSLFLSDDAGNHWKAVPAQWKGRAVKVGLAFSPLSRKLSAGAAAGEASGANFGAIGGPVRAKTAVTSATLMGSVTDTSGAAISDASVVVGNATTPNARTVKTDHTGHYLVEGLVPGSYQVAVEAPGFNKQQLDVTVTALQQSSANLTLSVGQASQTVAVSAASEAVDVNASLEHAATLSVARKNKTERSSASESSSVFEITTDTGEHWTSIDGHTWKRN